MDNAPDWVKAIADYITLDVAQSGLAAAINKYLIAGMIHSLSCLYPWFIWPLGGWGIGLLFHFLGVFVFNKQTGWEKREIEKEMEKMRHSK